MKALRKALHQLGEVVRGRTVEALDKQLKEAQRAAQAARRAHAPVLELESTQRFLGSRPEAARAARQQARCKLCCGPVEPPRRTLCSDSCAHQLTLRAQGSYLRKCLVRRDSAVCSICGVNAGAAARAAVKAAVAVKGKGASVEAQLAAATQALTGDPSWVKLVPHLRLSPRRQKPMVGSLWQGDHINPVSNGGGLCGLENMRTLCSVCHSDVTKKQAASRSETRKLKRKGSVLLWATDNDEAPDCAQENARSQIGQEAAAERQRPLLRIGRQPEGGLAGPPLPESVTTAAEALGADVSGEARGWPCSPALSPKGSLVACRGSEMAAVAKAEATPSEVPDKEKRCPHALATPLGATGWPLPGATATAAPSNGRDGWRPSRTFHRGLLQEAPPQAIDLD